MHHKLIEFVRDYYHSKEFISLHEPVFGGKEREYLLEAIDSTFVSSVGAFVDRFEADMATYTGCPKAVATVNGTAALHVALKLAGVESGNLVITQPLTFVATCNAITYCGAEPVFVDVDLNTLGLSAKAMQNWLEEFAFIDDQSICRHKVSQQVIRACLPMHTFGHPADIDGIVSVCQAWNLALVEDAAESLGSLYKGKHTGTFGLIGALSFNGNKIITTGGGGMMLTSSELGTRAKYLTTTAKQPHPFEFVHNELAYNYRLPNLNAALGCAQLEQLESYITEKRLLANSYASLLLGSDLYFMAEPENCRSNYWLNAVICTDKDHRDELLKVTNDSGVMTRPIWQLMNRLPMYEHAFKGTLDNAYMLEQRVVNIPSGIMSNFGKKNE